MPKSNKFLLSFVVLRFDCVWLGVHISEVNEVTQSCPTFCDSMDCSLPGSSLHGILQARVLEWVAISFSRGSPDPGIEPGSPAFQADALASEPPGKLQLQP